MRVSELVTIDQINSWNSGDIITIKAGTGSGKSYFIKNNLYAIAKKNNTKILFLLHRINCTNQFREEILQAHKEETIHIITYQYIETLIRKGNNFDFFEYDYIVCDEFHYFMSDAAFNKTTDISLNAILDESNSIRIFMSATGDYMQKYINQYKKLYTIDYELPINYNFIQKLTFYNKDSTLDIFINEAIQSQQKAIFFIQSAKKAYEFYCKYKKYCLFNCSKNNDQYYQYVDKSKINQMLLDEKFNELVLITTTCLDTGVNIIDDQLKHIICDVKNIGTIIQCIGRKRLSKNDNELYVHVKSMTNQQLGGMETQLKKKLEMARFLKDHTPIEYVNKYQRELDYSHIVYDDVIKDNQITKKINWLMYFKCVIDVSEIQIMKDIGQYGFCKALARKLGKGDDYRLIEEEIETIELENYLDSIVGKKLLKDEQKELINKVNLKDSRGRIQKSINILNAYFIENKMNYMIVSKVTSEIVENKKKSIRYWEVLNNISNKN